MDSSKKIDKLISSIDENNQDLREGVATCEEEVERLEQWKEKMGLAKKIPGKKIENLMADWGKQKTYTRQ